MRIAPIIALISLVACEGDCPENTKTITNTVTNTVTVPATTPTTPPAPLSCADVDRSLAGEPLAFDPVTTLSGVYRVDGRQIYDSGEVVTVEPGTIFLMEPGASILVGWRSDPATMFMDGTEDEPILFCGTEAGKGHWLGLEFLTGTTPDSSLTHVVIEDAGLDDHAALLLDAPVDLVGVTLQGNLGVGLDAGTLGAGSDAITLTDNAWPATLGSAEAITRLPEGDYTGNGEDVIEVVGHENADVVFHDRGVPYRQLNDRVVYGLADGTPLSITYEAGVVYEMCQDCSIQFGWRGDPATVQALGTATDPVVFTSANPSPSPGDWNGVLLLTGTRSDSRFENTIFEYGGKAGAGYTEGANLAVDGGLGQLIDCTFADSAGYGLWLESVEPGFSQVGSLFVGNGLGDVYEPG